MSRNSNLKTATTKKRYRTVYYYMLIPNGKIKLTGINVFITDPLDISNRSTRRSCHKYATMNIETTTEDNDNPRAYSTTLASVGIKEVDLEYEGGDITHIEITYTLSTEEEDFEHVFNFYTDEQTAETWADFFKVITDIEEIENSLLYHIKRNGDIMREFVGFCFLGRPCEAA
jgi:hypothetical protein